MGGCDECGGVTCFIVTNNIKKALNKMVLNVKKALVFITIAFIMLSCATKTKIEYVDREVVKDRMHYVHDTEITRDTIEHNVFMRDDTVFDVKYVKSVQWKDKIVEKTDTFIRDSIQVQVKKEIVEKKVIPKWCYISLLICGLFAIFAIIKLILWKQVHSV